MSEITRQKISLTDDEVKKITDAAAKKGIEESSFSNLARVIFARYLKVDLPVRERGGIREGGFEPGNEHGHEGAAARWGAKKKKAAKK